MAISQQLSSAPLKMANFRVDDPGVNDWSLLAMNGCGLGDRPIQQMFSFYGQPAWDEGASKVSTCPIRACATLAILSMPRHSVAMMNNVFFSTPPSMHAKQPRSTPHALQHLTAFADAHAVLVGDIGIPYGIICIDADALRHEREGLC